MHKPMTEHEALKDTIEVYGFERVINETKDFDELGVKDMVLREKYLCARNAYRDLMNYLLNEITRGL